MTPAAKSKAAKYGLVVDILGFLSGGMLLCDCPGWFVCAGVAAALPAIWGTRVPEFPMPWLYLIIAGLLEVGWAIGLKYTNGFTRLWPSAGTVAASRIRFAGCHPGS